MQEKILVVQGSAFNWPNPDHFRIVFLPREGLEARDERSRELMEEFQPQVILLDERGRQLSSKGLAGKLANWQIDGRDLCFVIGGPDGVADACRQRADFTWSLSQLTLPHGLARVLFAEQLYRAHSLHTGHPYHRA